MATPNHGATLPRELHARRRGRRRRARSRAGRARRRRCSRRRLTGHRSPPIRSRHARDAVRRAPLPRARRRSAASRADRRTSRCRHRPRVAPASIISTASSPVRDSAGADDRRRRDTRARTSHTARSATGLIGGPDEPAAARARAAARASPRRSTRPITVLTSVSPVGARVERGARDRDDVGDVRRQLREHREPRRRARRRPRASPRASSSRRVREHVAARFDVRAREVDLDRDDAVRDRLQRRAAAPRTPRRVRPQIDAMTRAPRASSAGRSCCDPRVDARAGQARPS